MRRLGWAVAALTVYLLALGGFTALGFRSIDRETERRCEAFIRGYEILGEETGAEPDRIDRFVTRLLDETDC